MIIRTKHQIGNILEVQVDGGTANGTIEHIYITIGFEDDPVVVYEGTAKWTNSKKQEFTRQFSIKESEIK